MVGGSSRFLHHSSCTMTFSTCRVMISDMVWIKVRNRVRLGIGLIICSVYAV